MKNGAVLFTFPYFIWNLWGPISIFSDFFVGPNWHASNHVATGIAPARSHTAVIVSVASSESCVTCGSGATDLFPCRLKKRLVLLKTSKSNVPQFARSGIRLIWVETAGGKGNAPRRVRSFDASQTWSSQVFKQQTSWEGCTILITVAAAEMAEMLGVCRFLCG